MPLHLLGKKGWNVYNNDNIERVRRDEAEAQAREEAEEQRLQEQDAERRIAILRGEQPKPLPQSAEDDDTPDKQKRRRDDGLPRKRRKLRGEDDTDRDIRFARDDAEAGTKAKQALLKHGADDAPLHDHIGHLQLVPAPDEKAIRKAEKSVEAEAEKAQKLKRAEDQYTMRFSNAAGFKNGMAKPWYTAKSTNGTNDAAVLADVPDKDVWGNDDPRRKEREGNRLSSSDPFAAMQQAQRQLKQSARDRDRWEKDRQAEIEELKRAEERESRYTKKHRRRDEDIDSLEGFSLDAPSDRRRERSDHERQRRHHHRHRRHRSCLRERNGRSRGHSGKD